MESTHLVYSLAILAVVFVFVPSTSDNDGKVGSTPYDAFTIWCRRLLHTWLVDDDLAPAWINTDGHQDTNASSSSSSS
eukprot:CAMPEP_0168243038 /NCGR_PEP_ID=MMETSP0140_2-20121125/23794_1 /TAXON_ID=44445 /ORGANISM="Pseudo-nitzschia australis, Strain 10249 10 AB" /LENGTH=77 /DNA_ID=CAMNT_0008178287 /DNA_START=25 /DNA_END=255 /DNA_ORIENTATION=+